MVTGNITEWEWEQKGSGDPANTYAFTYDKLSRLTNTQRYAGNASDPVQSFVEQGLAYDRNGNITTLKRYGENSSLLHDFEYTYSGNQLTSLDNAGIEKQGIYAYGYDANGNMTEDGLNGLELKYNFLNLISEVSENSTPKAKYTWRADGVKLGVRSADGNDGFEYVGSLVYKRTSSGLELESAAFGGGRIIASQGTTTTYTPNYFLTDHLGSTRVVVDANGMTQQRNDYYAFGERWANAGSQISDNRYLFSGKEDQSSLGLAYSDFGARMLDKKLGRWSAIDPLAEKYYPWSPYNYALNNPIKFIDPDGSIVRIANHTSETIYRTAMFAATNIGNDVMKHLINSDEIFTYNSILLWGYSRFDSKNNTITWGRNAVKDNINRDVGLLSLGHESMHAFDFSLGGRDMLNLEKRAVSMENYLAEVYGMQHQRNNYGIHDGDGFQQFATHGSEKISNFRLNVQSADGSTYGFSYSKTTTQKFKSLDGKTSKITTTKDYFMTVNVDEDKNLTFNIYDNEEEYKKAFNW